MQLRPELKTTKYTIQKRESNLFGRIMQSVTAEACCEKIAKFIPLSISDTPSGWVRPGETSNEGKVSSIWGASS